MTVGATDVDGDRQIVTYRRFKDRPAAAAPKRLIGLLQNEYLREIGIASPCVNFGDRSCGVFLRDEN